MKKIRGAVSAGHKETTRTAETILRAGGNAFDAAVAAHLTACVAEPVLTSLGGGGFLLAHTPDEHQILYDFFVQTPHAKLPEAELDFYPIDADFGSANQEFHIGMGSVAVPGTVKGLFAVHRDLCSMPMQKLATPAVELARRGVLINPFQAFTFRITSQIYGSAPGCEFDNLPANGETISLPLLADFIETLSLEGEELFYTGDLVKSISEMCSGGAGHLTLRDLNNYDVVKRKPLKIIYRNAEISTNPPPASAGSLTAFALKMLNTISLTKDHLGRADYLKLLSEIQHSTQKVRIDAFLNENHDRVTERLLTPEYSAEYRAGVLNRSGFSRGTTHISIADKEGNIASLTTSNGEGCGRYIPGTGIMLNNMLGEEDLNTRGFHQWDENHRMTSMMAPGIVTLPGKKQIAYGSGGSNRIRTAILQVLLNLIDFELDLEDAISSPRLHFESGHLNIESGFDDTELASLLKTYPRHTVWGEKNLYFGGVHAVQRTGDSFAAFGDPRRGGFSVIL